MTLKINENLCNVVNKFFKKNYLLIDSKQSKLIFFILGQQIVKRLRDIQNNSIKDYNQKIFKIQKIVQQLKLAIVNLQQTPLQQKNCKNYLFSQSKVSPIKECQLKNADSSSKTFSLSSTSTASTEKSNGSTGIGNTNIGTLQKFIGRIRSIF